MKLLFHILFLLNFIGHTQIDSLKVTDQRYREDQFYISVTYNLLQNAPNGISQNGFSTGFHLGFIRDFPINKRRNKALGIGLGLSSNSYNQNMQILENNSVYSYSQVDESLVNLRKNKFTTYLIELPIEFRWRTSTLDNNKFWRIYPGVKLGYLLYNSSKLETDAGTFRVNQNPQFNSFQYGPTLSVGYGTWNFHCYYALNSIFSDEANFNGSSPIDLQFIKIGVIFYIL